MSAIHLNSSNFDSTISGSKPVLVDFWAPWCGPCKMLSPTIDEIATQLEGSVVIAKVNVDEEPSLAQKYSIASIPSLIIFKNGQIADMSTGMTSKDALLAKLKKFM